MYPKRYRGSGIILEDGVVDMEVDSNREIVL
jgi:hypothetical protein